MNTPLPDDRPPLEMLAALVDGELPAADRARVKRWLSEHPEAAGELADQEAFSRANVPFWREVAPPTPSPKQWNGVFSEIRKRSLPNPIVRPRSRLPIWVSGIVAAGIAITVLVMVLLQRDKPTPTPDNPAPTPEVVRNMPSEDDEVLTVARNQDVVIFCIPGGTTLLVGEHPLGDAPLPVAKGADLQVFSFGGVASQEPDPEEHEVPQVWPRR